MTNRNRYCLEILDSRRLLAAIQWDGGGSDRNWTNPLNWSGDVVPGVNDDVTILGSSGPYSIGFPPVHIRSLTLGVGTALYGLQIDGEFRVKANVNVDATYANVTGTGRIITDTGSQWYSRVLDARCLVSVPFENHGAVGLNPILNDLGPDFHNWGGFYPSGGQVLGRITNESTGVMQAGSWTASPGFPGPGTTSIGLEKNSAGQIVAAPFVNRGLVRTDVFDVGFDYEVDTVYNSFVFYVDQSPTLGGKWRSSRGHLTFTTLATGAKAHTTFDSTFQMLSGAVYLKRVEAELSGLPTNAAVFARDSVVTIGKSGMNLAVIRLYNSTLKIAEGGVKTLSTQDMTVDATSNLVLGDGLLVHGNRPGFMRPYVPQLEPETLPSYSGSVTGTFNGSPAPIDGPSNTPQATAFSRGDGLAVHYPAHVFRGVTFDDNDFIFFTTLRGDANFDRQVNFTDLNTLSQHYGSVSSRGYADGNFDNPDSNTIVGFDDLLPLAQNYGVALATAAASRKGSRSVLDEI